jgi:2,3-bisphosphoglycerate-dependent phosphoglycerate mutase
MSLILASLLTLLAPATPAVTAAEMTTVILVRHAEKAPATAMVTDVPLSDAGMVRAKELARVLNGTKIDAIYTTQYQRTRQTAEPLAKQAGVEPVVITAGTSYPTDLANTIRTKHGGQTVLVVGHSNTTPDVLRALGISSPPPIADSAYDDLFICTIAPGAAPKLVTLHYGALVR